MSANPEEPRYDEFYTSTGGSQNPVDRSDHPTTPLEELSLTDPVSGPFMGATFPTHQVLEEARLDQPSAPLPPTYAAYPVFGGAEEIDPSPGYNIAWTQYPTDDIGSAHDATQYLDDISPPSQMHYADTADIESTLYSPELSPSGESSSMTSFQGSSTVPLTPIASARPKKSEASSKPGRPSQGSSSKLRTASQAPRRKVEKPGDTDEIRQQRASHNVIERNYRHRLNAGFDKLIEVLPMGSDERRVSKSEVLESAIQCIAALQQEVSTLQQEKLQLQEQLDRVLQSRPGNRESNWN